MDGLLAAPSASSAPSFLSSSSFSFSARRKGADDDDYDGTRRSGRRRRRARGPPRRRKVGSSLIVSAVVVFVSLHRLRPVQGFSSLLSAERTRSTFLVSPHPTPPKRFEEGTTTMLREGGKALVRRFDRGGGGGRRGRSRAPSSASSAAASFALDASSSSAASAAAFPPLATLASGTGSVAASSRRRRCSNGLASSDGGVGVGFFSGFEAGRSFRADGRCRRRAGNFDGRQCSWLFSVAPRASNVASAADDDFDYPFATAAAASADDDDGLEGDYPVRFVEPFPSIDGDGRAEEERSKDDAAAVSPSGSSPSRPRRSPAVAVPRKEEERQQRVEEEASPEVEPSSSPHREDHPPTAASRDEDPLLKGLRSRPIPNGNWNPRDPLAWTETFGSRSPRTAERLESLTKLRPGDEGYFDVSDVTVKNVSIVRTIRDAKIVVDRLMNADPSIWHACDTEVMDIDLKSVGPVGNGYVTCVSMYSGPEFDYGLGDGPGSALWIDNLDDAHGILQEFKGWFEDERFKKVWHNYGFDRHVLWNEGINVQGFGGDTMHMARLQDTSRAKIGGNAGGGGYSLEALTSDLLGRRKKPMKELFGVPRLRKDGSEGSLVDVPPVEVLQRDPKFRSKWILYSAYDAEGTYLIRERLRRKLERTPWIKGRSLMEYYETHMRVFGEVLTDMERRGIRVDAREYLAEVEIRARNDRAKHLEAFRHWAASRIGPDGLALNPASSVQLQTFLFGGARNKKTGEETERVRVFKVPREEIPEEAMRAYEDRDDERKKKDASTGGSMEKAETDELDDMTVVQLKSLCKDRKLKVSGRKAELRERLREHFLSPPPPTEKEEERTTKKDDFDSMSLADLRDAAVVRGLSDKGKKSALVKRLRDDTAFAAELMAAATSSNPAGGTGGNKGPADAYRTVSEALEAASTRTDGDALRDILEEVKKKNSMPSKFAEVTVTSVGMAPEKYTAGGAPSVTADVLKALAGEPIGEESKYGKAYEFFGKGNAGHKACVALHNLCAIGSIDTMIANFLTSLQSSVDDDSRVHCSLNLNTETGRLSARKPNLQNQPALEKDKYQIRRAFRSGPGNNLIVADYGQLELRLLASMTNCESMIEAFEAGGDFHSRTALGMFDHIRKKVEEGECLLEWDYAKGDPPKPMLKDMFASERRKAKTLNFSIAYGKTAHGLSQDWGVSRGEAQDMLDAWYKSRPEVKRWQDETMAIARRDGITRTLMGRYRQLPEARGRDLGLVRHAERASINTPIQGGAADVAMMAMIKINGSELLRRLGWILLLQIHDEVILEGPEETAEEAFEEVVRCMEEPWVFGLERTKVPLLVDGSYTHKNWYDAK